MAWHEPFKGTEAQFDDWASVWHEDHCGMEFSKIRLIVGDYFVCARGHIYRVGLTGIHECNPFMSLIVP